MKKRHSAEQIVAKLRQADIELGKGLILPGFFGHPAGKGPGVDDGDQVLDGRRQRLAEFQQLGLVRICSGSRAWKTSFSALRYWICLAKWPRLAVTNCRSSGLMKRVGMVETFARNAIWARQKTINLYTALVWVQNSADG